MSWYSYRISRRLSWFLRMLGAGLSSAMETVRLSIGQVFCPLSHCPMQPLQNACSHLSKYYLIYIQLLICTLGFIKNCTFSGITRPWMNQSSTYLCPSSRADLEDSKTPPTCKVWMILSQVTALPKKQCFETIEDLLVFWTNLNIIRIFCNL